MPEPVYGLTQRDRNALAGVVAKHRQRLPDVGRRTRRVWPPGVGGELGGNNNGCCAASVCAPDPAPVTDCTEVPKLLEQYTIHGAGRFSPESYLEQDSGCVYKTECFEIFCGEDSLGEHYWEWTISEAAHTSTLKLLPCEDAVALGVVYRNLSPLNAFHANRFTLTKDWEILPAFAHLFPCELCIGPVAETCTDCPAPGSIPVLTDCCPGDLIPGTLYAHLADVAGCSCIIGGTTIELLFTGGTGPNWTWTGTGLIGICSDGASASNLIQVTLQCLSSVWSWRVDWLGGECGGNTPELGTPSVTCSPFEATVAWLCCRYASAPHAASMIINGTP